MMPSSKAIVFDVVGTLVCYDNVYEAMDTIFGERLRAVGVQPRLLTCCWLGTAEREHMYLALSGRSAPILDLLGPLFYRVLRYADVLEPRRFANAEEVRRLVESYRGLRPRSGAVECISKLRDAGFLVWAFTAGDRERVEGYLAQAGIDLPDENLISCHWLPKSKPDPDAYRPLYEELSKQGTKPWFAAAHMWDVSSARTIG